MILLHLPVSTADLCQWISDGDLLYYYSSKAAPPDLRRRLPAYLQRQLEPESVLRGQHLHLAVSETIMHLSEQYGMHCPPINSTLLLYRWLKILALPIEIFAAVRRISRMLEIKFDHNHTARSNLARMPELLLMALVVVAVKLLFPLDGIDRYSASTNDLSALSMDWDAWTAAADNTNDADHLNYQDALTATETSCLALGSDGLDQYLDWYQENIASEHVNERGPAARNADFRRAILSMFPTAIVTQPTLENNEDHDSIAKRLWQSQSELSPRRILHDQHRPPQGVGTHYRRYRRTEDLLSGSKGVLKLYELAAQHSGVSIELIIRAVLYIESKLEREEMARRRTNDS